MHHLQRVSDNLLWNIGAVKITVSRVFRDIDVARAHPKIRKDVQMKAIVCTKYGSERFYCYPVLAS